MRLFTISTHGEEKKGPGGEAQGNFLNDTFSILGKHLLYHKEGTTKKGTFVLLLERAGA